MVREPEKARLAAPELGIRSGLDVSVRGYGVRELPGVPGRRGDDRSGQDAADAVRLTAGAQLGLDTSLLRRTQRQGQKLEGLVAPPTTLAVLCGSSLVRQQSCAAAVLCGGSFV